MAGVFARRGVDAWVFRGDDGLDELTTTTTSSLWTVSGGEVVEHTIDPAALGIPKGTAEDLRGQDAAYNAEVVRRVLAGEAGPVRDAVLLNAGAALAVHAAEPGSVEERLAAGHVPGHRGRRLRRGAGDARALGRGHPLRRGHAGGRLRARETRRPVSGSRLETQPLVVGVDHARRGQHEGFARRAVPRPACGHAEVDQAQGVVHGHHRPDGEPRVEAGEYTTHANRFTTRKRSRRACMTVTIRSAEPDQPIRSSQDTEGLAQSSPRENADSRSCWE